MSWVSSKKEVFFSSILFTFAALQPLVSSSAAAEPLLTNNRVLSGAVQSLEIFKDWQVLCESKTGKEQCGIEAYGSGQSTDGKRKVTLQLSTHSSKKGKSLFLIQTPLDLLLGKGIEMRIDAGKPMRLAFRSCHAGGCLAPFALDARIARSFRKGNELVVRVFDLNGQPVDVKFSLAGFSAASKKAEI